MAENGATSLTTQPLLKTTQTQTLSKGSTWAIVCSAKQHYLFTELSAGLCPPAVSSTAAQVAAAAVGCAPTPPFLHSHTKSKRGCTKVRRPANPGVSQNHSTAWVGRNLEDRSVLTPPLGMGRMPDNLSGADWCFQCTTDPGFFCWWKQVDGFPSSPLAKTNSS